MPIELGAPAPIEKPSARKLTFSFGSAKSRKVGANERMFFTEQLVLLLGTGVALHPALEALRRQITQPGLAVVVEEIRSDIEAGRPFSEALARRPEAFSETYVRLVEAGEKGGFLQQVLRQLHEMDARWLKLRSSLAGALSYPAFLAVFSLAVVVFILVFVYPRFTEHFRQIRDQLPATTLFLMGVSEFLRRSWLPALGGFAVFAVALGRWLVHPRTARYLDGWTLAAPALGALLVRVYLVQILRVMSLSLSNGVGVLEALGACTGVVRNSAFRGFLDRVAESVREGRGFSRGFQEAPFIPPVVRQMVSTGEETGNLAFVMGRLADFYEVEIERKLAALSKMMEPCMLLLMGVLVGVIVSSLILPIFKLSNAVR